MRFCQFTRADRQTDRSAERTTDKQSKRSTERVGETREEGASVRARIIFSQKSDGGSHIVIQSFRRRLIPSPSLPPIPLVSRVMMTRSPRGSCTHRDPRGTAARYKCVANVLPFLRLFLLNISICFWPEEH